MNSQHDEQLQVLFRLIQDIRAPILEQAIWIEKIIEDIISHYFCPEEARRALFFSLVINGTDLTFSSKIKMFERLLQLRYQDLAQEHSRLIGKLDKVRRFRNRMAHAMLDTSDEFIAKKYTDRIQLVFFENGETKKQIVTLSEKDNRLEECSEIINELVNVQEEIVKRVSSTSV